MRCDEVRERLVVGEPAAESQVSAHLESCPECREFAVSQRELDAGLRAAFSGVAMPARLRSRIREAARERERRAWWAAFGEWAPLAVGLVLTLVCMALVPTERAVVAVVGGAVGAAAYLWEAVWGLVGGDG